MLTIEISRDAVGVILYKGPIPTPWTIYSRVMDEATKEGDEYIFTEHPKAQDPTGIMTLEGTTLTFVHRQKPLLNGKIGKWPKYTANGKTIDTFNNPKKEVDGTMTVTYQPSSDDVIMTVIMKEEPKEEKEEDEAMSEQEDNKEKEKDEDAMSEQEDNKEKEKEEEAMSDEEDKKKKEYEAVQEEVNTLHPHMVIANRKAAASLALQEAANKAAELKAAQDKADRIAYEAMSQEYKTALAGFKKQKEVIKDAENDTFLSMYAQVRDVPLSIVPNPFNATKPVARAAVRALDAVWAKEANAETMTDLLRLTAWYNFMENEGEKINTEKIEKYFNMWLQNNPEECQKAQEALRAYQEDAKKPKKRVPEEAAGSSSRGSKAPRRAMCAVSRKISAQISAGLKVKEIVKALEKEGAKSNKKD